MQDAAKRTHPWPSLDLSINPCMDRSIDRLCRGCRHTYDGRRTPKLIKLARAIDRRSIAIATSYVDESRNR